MDISPTVAAVALIAGFILSIIYNRQQENREADPGGLYVTRSTVAWRNSRADIRTMLPAARILLLLVLIVSSALPAQAQLGFHKKPVAASAASDDGLPKSVVYNEQKYLLTPGASGMTYTVAIEGSPSPIGMVIKAPNAPVKYRAFDNSLETAATVKAVYAAFLNPPGDSSPTASSDSVVVSSFDAAKKEATVQTPMGAVQFTNGVNDFKVVDGSNTIEGHFSDGSTATQKAGHLFKSIAKSVSTLNVSSTQAYAGSVLELRMNGGPKSAFGLDGKAKDIGPSGAANAGGIKFTLQPKAGTLADAAAKAAVALGLEKPAYLQLLNTWKDSSGGPGGAQ